VKDESIILGFTAQKAKQEVSLPLTFKLRSEGQLKPWGDLFFWRRRKGTTWKKQLLYYRTEHTQDWQQSAISQINIFESIPSPAEFKRWMTGPTFFSVATCGSHSFRQSWKHAQGTLLSFSWFFGGFFWSVLSSLNLLSTLH